MRDDIDFLIASFEFFKAKPNEKFNGLSRQDILSLAKLIICDLPRYKYYTDGDFEKFTFDDFEKILTTEAADLESNIPENLKSLVENFERYQEEIKFGNAGVANANLKIEIDKRIQAFKDRSVLMEKARLELQKEDPNLKPEEIRELVEQYEEVAEFAAPHFVATNPTGDIPEIVSKEIPYPDVFNGVWIYSVQKTREKPPTERVLPKLAELDPGLRDPVHQVLEGVLGEVAADGILLRGKKEETEINIGNSMTPLGIYYIKTVAAIAVPEIAKKDVHFADAMQIYYQLGMSAQQFDVVAKNAGLKPEDQAKIFKYLRDFQDVHTAIAESGISPSKAAQLIAVFRSPGGEAIPAEQWVNNFQTQFPVGGFRGFIVRAGQQFGFGKPAANIFQGIINKGLAKIGQKVVSSALGKAAAAAANIAIPGIGGVVANIALAIGSRLGPLIKRILPLIGILVFGGIGLIVGGVPLAILGGLGGGIAGGAITGGSISAGVATITGGIVALAGAFAAELIVPFIIAIVGIPVAIALILFIINSGAYVVPPGAISGQITPGSVGIVCNTTSQSNESTLANAAACIVADLNQFNLNPLFGSSVSLQNQSWISLKNVLAEPAVQALADSATSDNTGNTLQCVGFVAATAALAGQTFPQNHDACAYAGNAPAGYTYVIGTSGMQSGDFFIIDGKGGCDVQPNPSPGHIGVVVSVDGALISCADANEVAPGEARVAHGCFALTQIEGYLRKQ